MAIHDHSRVSKFARERFASALMSDTKWRKLFNAIERHNPAKKRMVVKFIDVEEPREMAFPPSLEGHFAYMDTIEFGPVELRSIEWLEIPIDVEPIVSAIGQFPLEQVEGGTRIVGYRA